MKRETVVTIYVRHQGGCKLEGKNFARGCDCPKWLRYSLDGRQYRVSSGTRSWDKAEAIRKETEESLRQGGTPAPVAEEEALRTLAKARMLFLVEKETGGVSDGVLKKYKRETDRFVKFMEAQGLHFPGDIDKLILLEYRADWEEHYPSSATRQMVQARLQQFLRFMQEAGWIDRVPRLKAIKVDVVPTMPLTTEQYISLLGKVRVLYTGEKAARIHALVQLMRHTALAIRDAVTLERTNLIHDQQKNLWRVQTHRQKTGTAVSVPLPYEIALELRAVLNGNPKYVFWNGTGLEQSAVTNWQHDLRALFRKTFGSATIFTPHCLRDTAAVEWLAAGIPIEEVAKLLGHSSVKTTEKHYSPWVKARQDRLDSLVVATWSGNQLAQG